MPLWNVEPANDLLTDRSDNEAFVAATSERKAFVMYFPASPGDRSVVLDVGEPTDQTRIDWINIDTGHMEHRIVTTVSPFSPPNNGNFVAVLRLGAGGDANDE